MRREMSSANWVELDTSGCPLWAAERRIGASDQVLGLQLPRRLVVERTLTEPSEGVRRYFGEAPAKRDAGIGLAQLHDILALRPSNLPGVVLSDWIAPHDVPCIDAWIIDPQRGAIEYPGYRPHILDGAAFKRPADTDFPMPRQFPPVVREYRGIHLPRTDEPAIETHLVGPVGGRAIR